MFGLQEDNNTGTEQGPRAVNAYSQGAFYARLDPSWHPRSKLIKSVWTNFYIKWALYRTVWTVMWCDFCEVIQQPMLNERSRKFHQKNGDNRNRLIHTIVDFMTWYQEVVILKIIETEIIAHVLLKVFSRVGLSMEKSGPNGRSKHPDLWWQKCNVLASI